MLGLESQDLVISLACNTVILGAFTVVVRAVYPILLDCLFHLIDVFLGVTVSTTKSK